MPSIKRKCLQDATAATKQQKSGFTVTARTKLTTANEVNFMSDLRHIYDASSVTYHLFISYLTEQSSWHKQFWQRVKYSPALQNTFYYLNSI